MSPIKLACIVVAIVFFILYSLGVSPPRGNFLGAGLAFWAIATVI